MGGGACQLMVVGFSKVAMADKSCHALVIVAQRCLAADYWCWCIVPSVLAEAQLSQEIGSGKVVRTVRTPGV